MFKRKKLLSVLAAVSVLIASLTTIAITQQGTANAAMYCEGHQVGKTYSLYGGRPQPIGYMRVYWNGSQNCVKTTVASDLSASDVKYVEATLIANGHTKSDASTTYNHFAASGELTAPGCITAIGTIGYGAHRWFVKEHGWCG